MKDMRFEEVRLLVDFMYKGEVNVTQDDLPSLLKSAEALQIRGLCGSEQLLGQQQFRAQVGAAESVVITEDRARRREVNGRADERTERKVEEGDAEEAAQQQRGGFPCLVRINLKN